MPPTASSSPSASAPERPNPSQNASRILIAFGCVYFFWGSTFVAIRFGVAVLPALVLSSARYLIAGPLMLALCALGGLRLRQSWRNLGILALIGVLMLGLGNTGLVWSEQFLSSGFASLLIASIPLFVAILETVLPNGERLRTRGWLGIAVGFTGLLILVIPGLRESRHGHSGQLIGATVAIASAFVWSCASVLARRSRLPVSPFVAAGWEMTFGGLFNVLLTLAFGGRSGGFGAAHFSMQAALSVAYLVVFGSLVGYSSYVYLLDNVPVAKVSTYAYINPIVAVILGAIFLRERMVAIEYAGMTAILIAVYLVTSSKLQSGAPAAIEECVAAEPPA
ncbi:EamA family transporter [Granulicella sp. WH15]|uniref:EamA family transporter n=1 Tax=Granulicella sp. WH15 TaxID=2602070 RepID=UPI001366D3BE|nr:EamA family transporter [Granulicella sp. WH15]QHN04917.1 EamA family transporter [Granulicella sp. WH15]